MTAQPFADVPGRDEAESRGRLPEEAAPALRYAPAGDVREERDGPGRRAGGGSGARAVGGPRLFAALRPGTSERSGTAPAEEPGAVREHARSAAPGSSLRSGRGRPRGAGRPRPKSRGRFGSTRGRRPRVFATLRPEPAERSGTAPAEEPGAVREHARSAAPGSSLRSGRGRPSASAQPRPTNGIFVAITVMNSTLASSGILAM
jgi:hypothetical protein